MNRRHLLAGAAALPLAGIAADVRALNIVGAANDDPLVAWYEEWKEVRAECTALAEEHDDWDKHPRMVELSDREFKLDRLIVSTPAASVAGLVAIAALALDYNGHRTREDDEDSAEREAEPQFRVLRNMFASAQRLA